MMSPVTGCYGTIRAHFPKLFPTFPSWWQSNGKPCPNRLSLDGVLGKDWPPVYDSLYRVLRHDQLKSCDKCRC